MKLPVARCPRCRTDVVVYRTVALGEDPLTAPLETRCVDCDARLDRFGVEPEIVEKTEGGRCFETKGCDGCPKIGTRPW